MATSNSINSAIPIEIAKGGTNSSSMTNTYGINYYDGSSIVTTTVGTTDQVLTSNGAGVAPTFQDAAAGGLSINSQTGTTYTLVLSDNGKMVSLTNAATITLTVPPNSSVALPIGSQVLLYQGGAGMVSVAAGSGVTIRSADTLLDLYAQYSTASLVKMATDTWSLFGDLA